MKKQTMKIITLTALVTCAFNLHSAAFDPNNPPQSLGSSLASRMTRAYVASLLSVEKYRSAFASQEAFEDAGLVLPSMSIGQMLPDIAQEHKLYQRKELREALAKAAEIERNELEITEQPAWLWPYFSGGFSVKDLNDNGLLPDKTRLYVHGRSRLGISTHLDNNMISDLIGIQDIPRAITISGLLLSQNKLAYVDAGALRTFKNLLHLSLEGNYITSLSPEAFVGLDNLTTLDLSNNCLTAIPVGTFSPLSLLRTLALRYNSIPESERARIQAEIPNVKIHW